MDETQDVRNVVSQLGELVEALTREGGEAERGRLGSECAECISRLSCVTADTTPDRQSLATTTQSTPRKRSPHPLTSSALTGEIP